jgi:NAD+ diphosphatase
MYMNHYIFKNSNILIETDSHKLPDVRIWNKLEEQGMLNTVFEEKAAAYMSASFAAESGTESQAGCTFIPLRQFFAENSAEEGTLAARAKGLQNWRAENRFCPACGATLSDDENCTARKCPSCGKQYFPRIEPCIIVLITKGKEMLLARHKMRNQDIYTCIAGFIEIGESAEQAVVREVQEEVGLEIKDLRYVGSQGWPFPDQLMLAYRAEYKSGEIRVQEAELYEAKWFSPDSLPACPKAGSMGWKLISGVYD